ncbi:MAG: glucose-1-phosphate adenylyltransferase [Dehalococcoidia bacterium]|nr:glucose-1-phosphate adenylyltransferase [Dehalococcoidia bacterium]
MAKGGTLAIVLAGGEGKRLQPLTRSRAKPAVPFGGHYRLIDFVLSNLTNARFTRIVVLTQYKSHSLDRHIAQSWHLAPSLGEYVVPVPAQMRQGPRWFAGSADAIFQNLNILDDEQPRYVLVFGADHVYRMDPRQMLDAHIKSGAGLTVGAIRVPKSQADQFGVIEAGPDGKITAFLEKPATAQGLADAPDQILASMGNYVFDAAVLRDAVTRDAELEDSAHDLGGSIVPAMVAKGDAAVYDFSQNMVPGQDDRERGYWRDVGTLESFHEAHMDLVSVHPVFNLYNPEWPISTWQEPGPPAKLVVTSSIHVPAAYDSLLCNGVIISGGRVVRSVLSPDVRVESGAHVEECVVMASVHVAAGAVVRNAIIDKNVVIPPGMHIGVDRESDRRRFHVTDSGLVVIGKNDIIAG